MSSESVEKSIDEVYEDRNLLAITLAVERLELGHEAGWHIHDGWPLVWFVSQTGEGIVSYHVTEGLEEVLQPSPLPREKPPEKLEVFRRDHKNADLCYWSTNCRSDSVGKSDENVEGGR